MKWIIDKQHDKTLLREYLIDVRGFSKRTLATVKHQGGKILVNNEPKTVRYILSENDTVEVIFPPEKRSEYILPEPLPLDIIYEDDDVLVINKPPNMATIPSRHHPGRTLANAILYHYDQNQLPYTVHVVTRLDRDTSGLLLIAKHRYSHAIMFREQQSGKVNRTYQAIVSGIPQPKEGRINKPIARDPDSILKRMVDNAGQEAITNYRVMEVWKQYSLVEISLETGRTHQIRVHLTDMGHPLAGDRLYGGSLDHIGRQALHCTELAFYHPMTRKRMSFTLPLAEDLAKIKQTEI
ncbi:RluA family pseudouridine synthase [Gracilibacillus oryzae]|uniref:Pseudouridine synthase n=1 Tax=Gracilibacillus oryzae TaxID=1672701 RepID=A0A7C8L638_9BACI|nr:RluA family pseudouridine synthase [Gracilibacillus oryzae]KAB8139096.1 RluA family pseudouridine synthase [Gracilibacillus oryzae]